MSLEARAVHIG